MILDALDNAMQYRSLHPRFQEAFAFLLNTDLTTLVEGRREIVSGGAVYALVMTANGVGREAARLEVHRRAVDIQVTVQHEEIMGWRPIELCREAGRYDPEKDVAFFQDTPLTWLTVPAGAFAVFFP